MRTKQQIEDLYPLSPVQHGMLFHSLFAPEVGLYFVQKSCTLFGELNLDAFERAWQKIIDRHPVLRTAFVWEELDEPVQVVYRRVRLPLQQQDWRDLSSEEQQARLAEHLKAERRQGFDLTQAPLMRLHLIRLTDDSYRFTWSHHHLLLDGWCNTLILKEVFTFYEAFSQGREIELPESRPFRDYIGWLQGRDLSQAEKFWRSTLKGFTTPTPLKVDSLKRTRDAEQSFSEEHTLLSLEATQALQAIARKHRLTMHTIVQGAWALLLRRYSGQSDVLFGDVVAGRPAEIAGIETMMGMFINALPVRVEVTPTERLLPWLLRLQEQQIESRQYEYSPLVQVQKWSDAPTGATLFETLLGYQNYPVDASLRDGRSSVRIDEVSTIQTANNPIIVTFTPVPELMTLIKYDCSRFEVGTIRRMLDHLTTVLEAMAANPNRCLAEYEVLTAEERQQLLVEWNETATSYPAERQVQELFEEQAGRTPEAVALVFDGRSMTYSELNERANQLAHHLRSLGVGAESLVGLCLGRSVELIVGMLGILKAGGAYVPLDPSYPVERLSFMMEDSGVEALVAEERLLDELPSFWGPVVCLDSDSDMLDLCETENLPAAGTSAGLAYVIYTSGSTGTPKGISIVHSAITRLVCNTDYITLTPQDRVAQASNSSFDAATFEVWGALLNGARLVGISKEVAISPVEMAEQIREQQISTLFLTTALFNQLADSAPGCFSGVRHLLFGGEAVDVRRVRQVMRDGGPKRLLHVYGPTESTTFATWQLVEKVEESDTTVTIGKPLANTLCYVLDDRMQPVPVGVDGELYIGGDGLARCYLKRPETTAERFVPHPFSQEAGARLYRTGDRVRYTTQGEIEFLGRVDNQVKVRGHRIELGEIEAMLSAHHAVREATVIVRDDSGDRRLVAYVVPAQEQPPATEDLRHYLGEKLPSYMMPSRFLFLEALPLTPNGKVDRRALPAPDATREDLVDTYLAPQTPTEEMLANIWSDVLAVEQISICDNFFELGGHSLLATQVMSRLREAFSVEIPFRELFDQPTLRELAQRVDEARRVSVLASAPPLEKVEHEGGVALSFAQQRLWFLDQLEPGNSNYNIPIVLRLKGALDVAALKSSINGILLRHETLRTSFSVLNNEPIQVIAPFSALTMPLIDLSALPAEQAQMEAIALRDAEARHSFNLAEGPLLTVKLLRLADDEHLLLLTMHHIIADGWSMGILVREVAALYEAHRNGIEAELPELPIQYADYAVWQRQYLSGEVLEQQLSYWTKQLAGAPAVLELPTDRPRPAVQSFRGSALSFSCSPQVSQALRAFSKREGVTLYMTLLAAFAVLLQRYSGENEIVIGTPIANRNRMEVEGLIGFFVNSLAMHVKVGADPTFGQLVESVREVVLGAYAHQDVPFERIVEELKPERDLSRAPIFQVMFAWQNAPAEELGLEGVRISYEGVRTETTKYDMGLTMWERDGGGEIEGLLDYSTDLYDEARMRGLSEHFTTLLENIVANPEGQLSSLTRLPEAERRQQLVEWNATQTEYPSELCIHQLFEAQTARTPDACAVICQGQQLTYRELNERANRLAHYLRKLGVKAESIVGLCMEQSTEMMVAMLGILKAGGAYLPLDPSYPVERLNFLLEDARVGILLTRKSLAEKFGTRTEQVICLDTLAQTIEQESEENVACHLTAGNLAYVIYTSGSTGMPKGVLVQHRGLVNHSTAVAARYGLQAGDRVLQFASTSFDVAAEEIYPTWLSGGTVVLWPERHQVSFIEFERFVESQELSVLNLPTPYWQEWVQALISRNGELPAPLRLMIVGSAQGLPERFASWQKIAGERVRSFNAYGPTEATITSTVHELNCLPEGCELQSVLIGRPIANTQAYLLDEQLRPVPTGVAGELFLGGAGLARGYLNQSALTAERFIPNPFSQEAGARLYRTGDRVRYTTQGEIEFLGRVDNQVKVRGHRIELGEIEAVLAQHDAVRDVVVVASDSISQEKFLAAYVVAMPEPPPTAELRAHLRARLPEYMVPASFLFLEALPLTPNGKVDRRALPAPDSALPSPLTHLAPRTATEELLSGIWSEVLKLEGFGIRDNFFDLGGHSLLATQAISRVREVFGIEVALRQLFEGPTVEALAEAIEAARRGGADVGQRLRIERTTRKVGTGIALSFAQQRLWFIDQLEPGSGFYNIPVALRLQGELDVAALERSFNELIGRHEPLRTRFATVAGEPVQVISDEWQVRLDVEDISGLSEVERAAEVERRAEAEAREGFDLAEGPLLRVKLLRLADDEHLLLLTMHHIIADGWSMGILVREVAALYEAHRNGIEAELPELPIQYADYAVWQREYLSGEVLEQQLSYWTKQLAGAPAVLELPTDRPRPEEQTYRGAQQEVKLSASVSEQLRALSRREGVTLYMTLLAAFDLLLYHYTRNEDVVVGTDVANRNLFEVEGLIGFFVNQLAMRVNLSGDPTFRELLQRVRKVSLEAYAHQEIPFDRLVDALKQERSLKYSPLFQVKLILQNTPMSELEIPGLTLSPVEINRGTSQLDLNLRLTEFDEAILGSLEYSTDLFDHSTMTRMLRRFETLLDELLKQPDARLSELLAALAEQEQQQKYVQERELKQSISHKLRNRRRTLSASQESKDAGEETSTEEVPALIG